MRPADRTFPTKTDAEVWLTRKEAEILNGDWLDPDAGRILFGEYAHAWIDERPGLRPKSIQLYRYLLRRHLAPGLGTTSLSRHPASRRCGAGVRSGWTPGSARSQWPRHTGCSKPS